MRTVRSPIWWVVYAQDKTKPVAAFPDRTTAFVWAKEQGYLKFDKIVAMRTTFRKTASGRDKSRYAAYLHADSGLSFIEWLKMRRKFYY